MTTWTLRQFLGAAYSSSEVVRVAHCVHALLAVSFSTVSGGTPEFTKYSAISVDSWRRKGKAVVWN